MKCVSILTIMMFLVTSCSYTGTVYKPTGSSSNETTSNLYRYNSTACILAVPNDNKLVIDAGISETVVEFDVYRYLQQQIKEAFAKTYIITDRNQNSSCNVIIAPRQKLVCAKNSLLYEFEMKMYDASNSQQIFSNKTSGALDCEKGSAALMFFSTLLFPPVLGGFFYGINAHGKAVDNFESADKLIRQSISTNINAFEKAEISSLIKK